MAKRFILPDKLLTHAFGEENCATIGDHDDGVRGDNHEHFFIIIVGDDGVVTDLDWGYHSVDEAREVLKAREVINYGPANG